jgi:hypothetical protein
MLILTTSHANSQLDEEKAHRGGSFDVTTALLEEEPLFVPQRSFSVRTQYGTAVRARQRKNVNAHKCISSSY